MFSFTHRRLTLTDPDVINKASYVDQIHLVVIVGKTIFLTTETIFVMGDLSFRLFSGQVNKQWSSPVLYGIDSFVYANLCELTVDLNMK